MTEREYRALHRLSYSWVKLFIEDRLDFYDRFECRIVKKENPSKDMIFGSLVDVLALKREAFSEKFVEATVSKPGGHMEVFLDELYRCTLAATSEEGFVTKDMDTLMEEAYNKVAFDASGNQIILKTKPLKKLLAEFEGSAAEKYYLQQRQATGKHLVDMATLGYAEKVVEMLQEHDVTRSIMGRRTGGRYTIYNQLIILFHYLDTPFKSMLDRVEVDHAEKVIQPYDLKTTNFIEDFDFIYRRLRYYIQGILYYYALLSWKEDNGLNDYRVLPMKFILAHPARKLDPLIYQMSRDSMREALNGFEFEGRSYMGLREAVECIEWHRSSGIWQMSSNNYHNSGICNIKTYGDYEYH